MPPTPHAAPSASSARLLRILGVAFGLAVIVGNTIGMGILRTPGEVAARVPSAPLFMALWAAGALYALLGALTLAELGAMRPRSGGQFTFVHRALGPFAGFVVGFTDFLATCGSLAAVAIVLAEYAGPLVPALEGRSGLTASAIVVAFALLQWRGVRIGDGVQRATSLLKAIALLALAGVAIVMGDGADAGAPGGVTTPRGPDGLADLGAVATPRGHDGLGAPTFPPGLALGAIILALQSVIYTYDGWTGPIYFGDEVRDPARSIPRSMIGGVLLVMLIYLALNAAFLRVVPIREMAGDPFVAATVSRRLFGPAGDTVIRLLMLLSLLAAVNALQLMAARVLYGMSDHALLPARLAGVNRGGTPGPALLAGTLAALAFIATNTFETTLAILAFFFVASYALSFASLFVLRRREPDAPRPFRVPLYPWLPALALLGSVAFLVGAAWGDPANTLRAAGLLALSVPLYLLLRRRSARERPSPSST